MGEEQRRQPLSSREMEDERVEGGENVGRVMENLERRRGERYIAR